MTGAGIAPSYAGILASVRLHHGFNLLFAKPGLQPLEYPTSRVQKGLIIARGSDALVEEGVGFGLPLVRFGNETIFPGNATLNIRREPNRVIVRINYHLNLILRRSLRWGSTINTAAFYQIDEVFSRLHRQHPSLRDILRWAAHPIKFAFGIDTTFQEIEEVGMVSVAYDIYEVQGLIRTNIDLGKVKREGRTEVVIANEQGANFFNLYRDSNGTTLEDNEIGNWDETLAHLAYLVAPLYDISFGVSRVQGARLFRGREVRAHCLAWSGLNYVLPGETTAFAYDIRVGAA